MGEYTLQELCDLIRHKIGLEVTAKHMSSVLATNVGDEQNPLVRVIPLPLKNLVMKAVFDTMGENQSCMSLSNLGVVQLPEVMRSYVQRMDFVLGVQATAPYNCGALTYGDTVYLNFIRNICDAKLERHYYRILQELGIPVTVESNQEWRK